MGRLPRDRDVDDDARAELARLDSALDAPGTDRSRVSEKLSRVYHQLGMLYGDETVDDHHDGYTDSD